MLLGNLKYPFLTDENQKYQRKHAVHLLDKICYICKGTPRPQTNNLKHPIFFHLYHQRMPKH